MEIGERLMDEVSKMRKDLSGNDLVQGAFECGMVVGLLQAVDICKKEYGSFSKD